MRDDLPELIRMGKEKGFTFFQLNTNGIRLAEEEGYAKALKEAGLSLAYIYSLTGSGMKSVRCSGGRLCGSRKRLPSMPAKKPGWGSCWFR